MSNVARSRFPPRSPAHPHDLSLARGGAVDQREAGAGHGLEEGRPAAGMDRAHGHSWLLVQVRFKGIYDGEHGLA